MPRGTDQALSILPPSLPSPSSSSYIHPSFSPWFPPHRHHLYFPPVSHTSTQAVLVQQPSWRSLRDLARKFTRFLRVFDLSSSGNVAGADVEVDVGVVQNFKVCSSPTTTILTQRLDFARSSHRLVCFFGSAMAPTKHESDDCVQHFYIFFLRFCFFFVAVDDDIQISVGGARAQSLASFCISSQTNTDVAVWQVSLARPITHMFSEPQP